MVKPEIRKLAMNRGSELTKDSKEEFNLLLVRQAYLNKKIKIGQLYGVWRAEDHSSEDTAVVSANLVKNQRSVKSI